VLWVASDKDTKTLSDEYVQQRAVVPCVSAKSGRTASVGNMEVSTESIRVRLGGESEREGAATRNYRRERTDGKKTSLGTK